MSAPCSTESTVRMTEEERYMSHLKEACTKTTKQLHSEWRKQKVRMKLFRAEKRCNGCQICAIMGMENVR